MINMCAKLLLLFFTLLFCFQRGYTQQNNPELLLDATVKKQGDFFIAIVKGLASEPSLWFKSKKYKMFANKDGSYRALVPVENSTKPGRYAILAAKGKWKQKISVRVIPHNKPIQHIRLSKEKRLLRATKREKKLIKAALDNLTLEQYFSGLFLYPNKGEKISPFGVKRSYNDGPVRSYHKGIDFASHAGSPVLSTAKGKVILTGYVSEGFRVNGNTVIIDHGHGVISAYLHLQSISVTSGQVVGQGDIIGKVGSTGIATGPHLHWGVYLYGISVDPELFLVKAY